MTGPLAGLTVLVVEDQFLIADEMRRVIADLGGEVAGPAPNVAAAQALLEAGAPDVALLDINLDGEQVWQIAHRLRDLGVPVIFATGYEASRIPPAFQREPYLDKPVTAKALAAAVERLGLRLTGERGA